MNEYLTVGEVADRLRVCRETIRRWLRAGILKGFRRGNTWRVLASEIGPTPEPTISMSDGTDKQGV